MTPLQTYQETAREVLSPASIHYKHLNRLTIAAELYANQRVVEELMKFLDFVDGDGLIAKRVSYMPQDHDPIHSWPIITQEVLIVPLEQRKDRIASRIASYKGGE